MNIDNIPLEDWFETQLAQERDGWLWTVYLRTVPSFTFPSGIDTQITVNPWASNMQVVSIDAIDTINKTVNVSDITINSGAGDTYAQSTHTIWSIVRISATFSQWEAVKDAVNSKIDGTTQPIYFYANTTARDAALWATPSTDWLFVWSIADQQLFYSAWGTRNPLSAGSSVTPNASTTVAGKTEEATGPENTAWSTTGWTGAPLFSTPWGTATVIQSWSWVYCASTTGSDTYTASLTPALTAYTTGMLLPCKFTTTNTGACSININSLWAKSIKTLDGNDPQTGVIRANGVALLQYDWTNFVIHNSDFATSSNRWIAKMALDATATAWTDESDYINSKQLKNWSGYTVKEEAGTTLSALVNNLQSANTARSNTSATYIKVKEIAAAIAWTYTVYFEIKADASTTAFGRIYVDGVAVGTERSTSSTSYVWYLENITVTAGQLIQLYYKKTGTNSHYAQNFRLYGFIKPVSLVLTVNTD